MTESLRETQKQWWTPVWTGLVMDGQGRHYYQMRNALWLFLYLLLNADRKTGYLLRKVNTICQDTGINRQTILRWLTVLRNQDYIATKNTGRCLQIQIRRWKTTEGVSNLTTQKSEKSDTRSGRNDTSKSAQEKLFSVHSGLKKCRKDNPNDITINKYILKNDIDRDKLFFNRKSSKGLDKKQLLALELADALDDRKSFALYISYSQRYPEGLLRKALAQAKAVPSEKIKKSRAALFNHLVQEYARKNLQDFGS